MPKGCEDAANWDCMRPNLARLASREFDGMAAALGAGARRLLDLPRQHGGQLVVQQTSDIGHHVSLLYVF